MASARRRAAMSEEHKAALAAGRAQGLVVRRYLEALARARPRRGRRPSTEAIRRQREDIEERLRVAEPLQRLHLIQQRKALEERLVAEEDQGEMAALEDAFVEVAAEYGSRKRIDYSTWREAGVPAEVLRRAGIHRKTAS